MPRVTAAEWKVITLVLRETVGWNQREDAEISLEQFIEGTGMERQTAMSAIKRALARTVLERRLQQVGRRRTYRYRAVLHANLKEVPVPGPLAKQEAFDFGTESKNWTPSRSLKIRLPTPLTESKNWTPSPPVLLSMKERRSGSKEKHTQGEVIPEPVENSPLEAAGAAAPRVRSTSKPRSANPHKSRHHKSTIRLFAEAQHGYTLRWNRAYPDHKREGIRNPGGWTTNAWRSGEHDDEIDSWLANPGMFGSIASGF